MHTGDDDALLPGLTSTSGGDEAEAPVQQARGSRWLSQGDDEDANGGVTPNEVAAVCVLLAVRFVIIQLSNLGNKETKVKHRIVAHFLPSLQDAGDEQEQVLSTSVLFLMCHWL